MDATEQAELNLWIHKHVFDGDLYVGLKKRGLWYRPNAAGYTDRQREAGRYTRAEAKIHEYPHDEPVTIHEFEPEKYTTDPTSSMEVLKFLRDKGHVIVIEKTESGTMVSKLQGREWMDFCTVGETLELSICLFAKKLFSK